MINKSALSMLLGGMLLFGSYAAADPTITKHRITAEVNPRKSWISVVDRFTVQGFDESSFRFLLHEDLEIESISYGDRKIHFTSHDYDDEDWEDAAEIEVSLPSGIESPAELTIRFNGVIYDSLASETSTKTDNTTGLIDERGAYLDGGTAWIPTILGAMYEFELQVIVPTHWESVSQGELLSRGDQSRGNAARWRSTDPMEEVYLVAGPWVFTEGEYRGIPIYGYLYESEDRVDVWDRYFRATRRFLDMYEAEITKYPHPKFAVVENFWETGFGMPSFTLLGTKVIRHPWIIDTSYRHEILHNWWGNGVYVDSDSGNWCEGLTSYGADHAWREESGAKEAAAYRRDALLAYANGLAAADEEEMPLAEFVTGNSAVERAVGYSKGQMVFHQLRVTIGEVAYYKGLKRFFRDRQYQIGTWNDIQAALEEESGEDLDVFFEQWVERAGAPEVSIGDIQMEKSGDLWYVRGDLRQSEPTYMLDVPVHIETESGTEELVVILDSKKGQFAWNGSSKPERVIVDPQFDLFRKLLPGEVPPSMSRALAPDTTYVLIDPEADAGEAEEYRALAEKWKAEVVDALPGEGELEGKGVWYFGRFAGDSAPAEFPEGIAREGAMWRVFGEEVNGEERSIAVIIDHPVDNRSAAGWFAAARSEDIAAVGRKIRYYGKYGFVAFEGDQNRLKEELIADSPFRIEILEER